MTTSMADMKLPADWGLVECGTVLGSQDGLIVHEQADWLPRHDVSCPNRASHRHCTHKIAIG